MRINKVRIGMKVWYYPILGGIEREDAVITSAPYYVGGTACCMINTKSSCVAIENLEERVEMEPTLIRPVSLKDVEEAAKARYTHKDGESDERRDLVELSREEFIAGARFAGAKVY